MAAHPTFRVRLHRGNLFGSYYDDYSIPIPSLAMGTVLGKGSTSIGLPGVKVGASQFQQPTLILIVTIPLPLRAEIATRSLHCNGSQPAAGEPGAAQPRGDVRRAAHDVPDQAVR